MFDHTLQPEAQAFADLTSAPPFLADLGVEGARKLLDDLQAAAVDKPDIEEEWLTVPAAVGDVRVRIVKPIGASGPLPAVLFVHGGGWVLGNAGTHDRLVREIATGVDAAVVFVEYDRSPEARHPVAIEQAYAVAQWITRDGAAKGLDAARLAIAGDSVGGNMAAVVAILAKRRGDVTFIHQSLYYPVTDSGMDTGSYREFAEGFHLRADAMAWFWTAISPTPSRARTSPPHRCRVRSTIWPGCPRPSSSLTRTTSSAMRAKPTDESSSRPGCAPPLSGTTPPSTIS